MTQEPITATAERMTLLAQKAMNEGVRLGDPAIRTCERIAMEVLGLAWQFRLRPSVNQPCRYDIELTAYRPDRAERCGCFVDSLHGLDFICDRHRDLGVTDIRRDRAGNIGAEAQEPPKHP